MSWWGSQDATSPIVISFGWFGAAGALVLFMSPASTTFRRIVAEGSVLNFDHSPYVISLIQCSFWVAYTSMLPGLVEPLVTNALGAALEATYCAIFVRFSSTHKCAQHIASACAAFGMVLVVAHVVPFPRLGGATPEASFVGIAACALNIIMYASPLNVACMVIRTKSVEFMPLSLTVGTLTCSACWTAYSYALGDLFIFLPSILGVLLAFFQLILYSCYYRPGGRRALFATKECTLRGEDEEAGISFEIEPGPVATR
ncbi:hypothetical protein CTAYLR_009013 [Chrysophaeum taylorii]|uniref:Bidirectional sugar transporter SWEET n=1 Tax=Chrysophaeum taylorii TaxID=2483200 RepID=A0AAD7XQP5_9STRA|nr:hypothetical protein CTAYLR_009013 [Chrysophaeum taylorii]